jgi:hypothetical protein
MINAEGVRLISAPDSSRSETPPVDAENPEEFASTFDGLA